LLKIIEIFNGNLQLTKRIIQFKNFVDAYNTYYGTSIKIYDKNLNFINLENA